jgi:hypothetical protein
MRTFLVKVIKGAAKASWKVFTKLGVKAIALFTALGIGIERLLSYELPEAVYRLVAYLSLRFVANTPQAKAAALEMTGSLWLAIRIDVQVAFIVLALGFVALGTFVGVPLGYKALFKRRLGIFISFNRAREDTAQSLQQCMEGDGTRIYRIAFQEGAAHQRVVMQVADGIKRCDGVVCLPGQAQSYVEHEVLAATAAEKPIAFLISENGGTLPNTADKRYPVFRLETTIREHFEPLTIFLGHVGADFRSTWKLCQRALLHPFMSVSASATLWFGSCSVAALWGYCYYDTVRKARSVTEGLPHLAAVETPVILAHIVVLGLLALITFAILTYVTLFVVNLLRQFHARRMARLKTVAAQFNRDDWVGLVPDLSPGGRVYESLFEILPSAHHEVDARGPVT